MGGLAELFSGAISMGLGAYLAAVTDRDRYDCEEAKERREVEECPDREEEEIYDILSGYGVEREVIRGFVDKLIENKEGWVQVSLSLCNSEMSNMDSGEDLVLFN